MTVLRRKFAAALMLESRVQVPLKVLGSSLRLLCVLFTRSEEFYCVCVCVCVWERERHRERSRNLSLFRPVARKLYFTRVKPSRVVGFWLVTPRTVVMFRPIFTNTRPLFSTFSYPEDGSSRLLQNGNYVPNYMELHNRNRYDIRSGRNKAELWVKMTELEVDFFAFDILWWISTAPRRRRSIPYVHIKGGIPCARL
jgi:hypothetical protein